MPSVIKLMDGKVNILFTERDFGYLVEQYMGYEAAEYFRELMDELNRYREEDEDYEQ